MPGKRGRGSWRRGGAGTRSARCLFDGELFRRRVRFVERGLGLWVKAALLAIAGYFLFVTDSFYKVMQPREDLLNVVRTFMVMYAAVGAGAAFVILGMRDVSAAIA